MKKEDILKNLDVSESDAQDIPNDYVKHQEAARQKQHEEYVSRGIPYNVIEILESKKLKKEQQERVEKLPWETLKNPPVFSDEGTAQELLDANHIGMEDVKSRIMDYYCSQFKNGATLLFVGPPGVGKTSIALQIAKACNRPWYKVSLSGIASAHEIIGVDPTFSQALPGEILRAVEYTNSFYPLIILDEIDKVGRSKEHGDPQNALLEVLDTNRECFRDRYLGIPIDLSNFIFIATANDLSEISPILRDRLEIIEIGGYNKELKKIILKEQVIPNVSKKILTEPNKIFSINDAAINRIIYEYVVEPGVRELYDYADKLIRHANRIYLHNHRKTTITHKNLEEYIGSPKRVQLSRDANDVIGSANTSILRSTKYAQILTIHTEVLENGTGEIICTGGIEGFAKEGVKIAKSLVRRNTRTIVIPLNFFTDKDIHVHSEYHPAIKKSNCVSLAIFITLVSTILKRPIPLSDMFAGNLALDGKIGYIKNLDEYLEAAIESNLKRVYVSTENIQAKPNLIEEYKEQIEIIPLSNINDVLDKIFYTKEDFS